ncbi:MAG: right-handed parallel beta-helix repeat-containing protein [Thermoleophilia bacterium]|nr:right-handed parallel beta-helix repeat-containing protein [Thermoleophilia bacterium]
MTLRALVVVPLILLATVSGAAAVPGGTVEVRDETGTPVATFGPFAPDAIQDAVDRIRAFRILETRPWSIVVGAGTYGDVAVATPNVAIGADAAATVLITGTGGHDDTGGRCIDVTRGNVAISGITCSAPTQTGITITLPNSEGGVALHACTVDRAGVDGVVVTGGRGVVLDGLTITSPGRDGIRLTALTTSGAHVVTGGSITGAGRDGLRLVDDIRGLQVTGLAVVGSTGYGIATEDAGNSDATLTGVTITRSGRDGVIIGGGSLRIAIRSSTITRNAGAGVRLAGASGIVLADIPLNGSNAGGDIVFTSHSRTGGSYTGFRAEGGPFALVGEPNAVRISGVPPARAGILAGAVTGQTRSGAAVLVASTARVSSRRVRLSFPVGSAVYRKAGSWLNLAGSRRLAVGVQVILGTSQLGTASTAYAPFG